jgi:hypothetical protein
MDRIYMNRIAGQERIHIEIAANEIADLLDDITPRGDDFAATKDFHALLVRAHADFGNARRDDAAEAQGAPAPACTAALLPRGSAPVDRCVVRGPHDGHRIADGARWTDADSEVR